MFLTPFCHLVGLTLCIRLLTVFVVISKLSGSQLPYGPIHVNIHICLRRLYLTNLGEAETQVELVQVSFHSDRLLSMV